MMMLIHEETTYDIRKAIFAVYNNLGFGHKEQVYQKALQAEFEEMKVSFKREVSLNVIYKGIRVGNYRPDFIIENKVIIEIKAVEYMPMAYEKQLLNYLKITGFSLGILVNFGAPAIQIKRLIWIQNP